MLWIAKYMLIWILSVACYTLLSVFSASVYEFLEVELWRHVFVIRQRRLIAVVQGRDDAGRTLRGLHDQRLAVLAHSAAIEGLHPGLVRAVEVETVHRADGLRPHVHFLQKMHRSSQLRRQNNPVRG